MLPEQARLRAAPLAVLFAASSLLNGQEFHQATGVKVGEVTTDSAVIWMRVTRDAERNERGIPAKGRPQPLPPDVRAVSLHGATPGMPGRVRVRWSEREDLAGARATPWVRVIADRDYAHQFSLQGLRPATRYYYAAETASADGRVAHRPLRGSFRTAPPPGEWNDVVFAVMTCQAYRSLDHPEGHHIYPAMQAPRPDFYVPNGDNVYLDNEHPRAHTVELARYHWQRIASLPRLVAFHLAVPGYWTKDDHDTWMNDCWPSKISDLMKPLTYAEGRRIFYEQTPAPPRPYRSVRWGRALEIFFIEGRDYRSPNTDPDGPGKTIWGAVQKQWLRESIRKSDADWKVMISPTPIVGPDREGKGDNHANQAFAHEGREIRRWLRDEAGPRVLIACGDRHWQYHSVDPETGLHEFSSGPSTDEHAGGTPGEDAKWHRFHRVKGGFLSGVVRTQGNSSSLEFRFHNVRGEVVYRYAPAR